MTQYRPFKKKKKIKYITKQTTEVDNTIENLKNAPNYDSLPASEFYKNAKKLYESDWVTAELEKISEATSITEDTLLPERATYAFSIPLNISEEFLPHIKIEIFARTNPDILIEGVFAYTRTAYKPVQFNLYKWHGITYTTDCCPQPEQAYSHTDGGCPCGFLFPQDHLPVPDGEHLTHVLPVGMDIVGYDNRLIYEIGGGTSESWWENQGTVDFQGLLQYYSVEEAKTFIDENYENIIYIEDEYPKKALEIIEEEKVATAYQIKKFIKSDNTNYTLEIEGDFLLISEAIEETSYSEPKYPTYQPNGQDLEIKAIVYAINPNYYSERKIYKYGT